MKKVLPIIIPMILIVIIGTVFLGRTIYPLKFKEDIKKYSKEYNIDPYLVAGIIKSTSGFRELNYIKGEKSGVMEIREETAMDWAKKMGIENFKPEQLKDVSTNIKLGTWYLGELKKQNNNTDYIIRGWIERHEKYGYKYEENIKKRHIKTIKKAIRMYRLFYIGSL
ncbi:transglycosylase SLT domain-containing protein [Tepidibacter thalassicus]|uniref:Transglycosylase SLT domain-containing protein n=1 Tax=Tepidibacter thalassicus DSM 15285 TaxID=1123350 RepID=A0A1M5SKE0_9FIRM|nr:transglycosylase SLT domain-containing protein [Tepidibacter thalassicus]SHH39067.1 Transglycosylase SLT domain-containing protein [Tepidibacter thalassicus DSM 15285]